MSISFFVANEISPKKIKINNPFKFNDYDANKDKLAGTMIKAVQ